MPSIGALVAAPCWCWSAAGARDETPRDETRGSATRRAALAHTRTVCNRPGSGPPPARGWDSPFLSASARMRLISQPIPHPWFAISVAIALSRRCWVTARTAALRSIIDVAETENLSLISRLGRQIGHHSWSFPGYARDQAAKSQRNLLGSLRPLAPTRPRRCNPQHRLTGRGPGYPEAEITQERPSLRVEEHGYDEKF